MLQWILKISCSYACPRKGQIPGEEAMDTSKWEDLGESFEASALPNSWTDLAVMAGKKADERFDPVCYVENSRTDSQVKDDYFFSDTGFILVEG